LAKPTKDGIAAGIISSSLPTAHPQRGSPIDPRDAIYRSPVRMGKADLRLKRLTLDAPAPEAAVGSEQGMRA
jgi:hypothetical protein